MKKAYIEQHAIIMAIIVIGLLITIIIRPSTCNAVQSGDYSYYVNEDGTVTLDGYFGDEKNVVVPDTVDGFSVTNLEDTFYGNKTIKTATLSEGITTIGNNAFAECPRLTYVHVKSPKSVRIFTAAFYGSNRLRLVNTESDGNEVIYSGDKLYEDLENYKIAKANRLQKVLIMMPKIVRAVYFYMVICLFLLLIYYLLKFLLRVPKGISNYRKNVFNIIGDSDESHKEVEILYKEDKLQDIKSILLKIGIAVGCYSLYFTLIDDLQYNSQLLLVSHGVPFLRLFTYFYNFAFRLAIPLVSIKVIYDVKQKLEERNNIYSKSKMRISR